MTALCPPGHLETQPGQAPPAAPAQGPACTPGLSSELACTPTPVPAPGQDCLLRHRSVCKEKPQHHTPLLNDPRPWLRCWGPQPGHLPEPMGRGPPGAQAPGHIWLPRPGLCRDPRQLRVGFGREGTPDFRAECGVPLMAYGPAAGVVGNEKTGPQRRGRWCPGQVLGAGIL